MNSITFAYAYYNASRGLKAQLELWKSYPEAYRNNAFFIVVDDGSTDKAEPVIEPYRNQLNISLYEVLEDIPWNDIGSVNLSFSNAETEWVLKTDLDYLLPAACFEEIMDMPLDGKYYYTFGAKKLVGGEDLVQHPSTFLLKKSAFWEAGGFDEDFTRNYGYVDLFFKDCINKVLTEQKKLDIYFCADDTMAVHAYSRDLTVNYKLLMDKRSGAVPQSKSYLRFPWRRVY